MAIVNNNYYPDKRHTYFNTDSSVLFVVDHKRTLNECLWCNEVKIFNPHSRIAIENIATPYFVSTGEFTLGVLAGCYFFCIV